MKKILSILVISLVTLSASAQENREMNKQHADRGMHKGKGRHGQKFMKDLNLSDAQKTQLKANREAYKKQMELLKQDKTLSAASMSEKKKALHAEQKAKMESILTAEQKNKLAESRAKQQEQKAAMHQMRAEKMKAELSLTDDQASKLKAQREATHAKIKAIKQNNNITDEQKKQQVKEVKEASQAELKQILTAEQFKKMEERKHDRQKKDFKQVRK